MIVAFLQNMWVKNPTNIHAMLAREKTDFNRERLRLRLIKFALFRGCITGRRLKSSFGEELCDRIIWEETTREIADNPKTIFPAQPEHIRNVIETHQPQVIVAFGRIAAEAVQPIWNGRLFLAPHPAARQSTVIRDLENIAKQIWWYRL